MNFDEMMEMAVKKNLRKASDSCLYSHMKAAQVIIGKPRFKYNCSTGEWDLLNRPLTAAEKEIKRRREEGESGCDRLPS